MRLKPVVNSILKLGFQKEADDLTHLKLQKLLYFLNGWYLAIHGEPVIDEPFEAWPYGPVVRDLYDELKKYGSAPIDDYLPEWDEKSLKHRPLVISLENKEFWDVLTPVWDKYSQYSAMELSTLSHNPGSPWAVTHRYAEIGSDTIRNYFLQLAKNNDTTSS